MDLIGSTFTSNSSNEYGGGIAVVSGSEFAATGNTFVDNESFRGGGMSIFYTAFDRDKIEVKSAKLQADGMSLFLALGGVDPVHAMAIDYNLEADDGELVRGALYVTVNRVGPKFE